VLQRVCDLTSLVGTRYPGLLEPVTRQEYEVAISLAEGVVRWAQGVIERGTGYRDLLQQMTYDRDDFFQDRLNGLQRRLRELGARKVRRDGGTWYWDLKPDWHPREIVIL
jgi:hypothetical protein